MGKIPKLLIIKSAINQPNWLFLADLQSPFPRQKRSQAIKKTIKNQNPPKTIGQPQFACSIPQYINYNSSTY